MKSFAFDLYAANRRSPASFCAPDTLMRTSSKQEAKPMMRFASPWPVTVACARYRSSAAVAIVPLQHVNVTVSDILIMARTTPRYIKRGWRFVLCPVTTLISCFRCDSRVATGPESILPIDFGLALGRSSGRASRGPVGAPRNDGVNFHQQASTPRSSRDLVDRHLVRDAAQRHASESWL